MFGRVLQARHLRSVSDCSTYTVAVLRHAPIGLQTLLDDHSAVRTGVDALCTCAACGLRELHSHAGRADAHSLRQLWPSERRDGASSAAQPQQAPGQQHALLQWHATTGSCTIAAAATTPAAAAALQQQPCRGRHTQPVRMHRAADETLLHAASQPPCFSTAAMSASPLGQPVAGEPASSPTASAAAPAAGQGAGGVKSGHPEQPAGATAAGLNAWWDDDGCFEYRAPLSTTVRRLKKLSLFSCAASIAAAPVIVGLDPGTAAVGGKAAIAGMLASFGMFTTGLLHWFVSPYVHTLRYEPANGWVEATRLSIFARPVVSRFGVEEAQYADTMRPQATFKVRGSYFYLDADHLGNQQLFDRLDIADPAAPAKPLQPPAESVAGGDSAPESPRGGDSPGSSPGSGAGLPRDQSAQESAPPGESLPRGAEEAPTSPPEPRAEEAAAKQAEQAAAMPSDTKPASK